MSTIIADNIDDFGLKKRELLEHVVLQTGIPISMARRVLDCAFLHCHERLSAGDQLALHPLGRVRIIDRETEKGPERIYKLVLQKHGF